MPTLVGIVRRAGPGAAFNPAAQARPGGPLPADPFDGVAQLTAQDELGILAQASRRSSNSSLLFSSGHQAQFAQLLDEATEQGLVEELRRGRRIEQAQRCAACWHRLSSSAAPSTPGPFFTSTEMAM